MTYRGTVFDASKLAKDPGPTTSVNQAFTYNYVIGDIVAVNGKPAKGLWTSANYAMPFRQAPQPGQPIADFDLGGTAYCTWTIFTPDGTPVGVITNAGLAAGVAGHTLTGGLASFSGTIGEHRTQTITAVREASTAEDPANRRNLGGGKSKVTTALGRHASFPLHYREGKTYVREIFLVFKRTSKSKYRQRNHWVRRRGASSHRLRHNP